MDKNKKIGFAVIGYGGMGSWHASTCADDFKDTAELIGIYDIKPERRAAAEAEGIHAFSSREDCSPTRESTSSPLQRPTMYIKK